MISETDVNRLPKKQQEHFRYEYDRRKLNTGNAWILWFFGFHYLHTGKVGMWFLYLISCFLYVWVIRWIIQAFMLNDEIDKKNWEIQEMIYWEIVK